mgnify:CR=1 FL=1
MDWLEPSIQNDKFMLIHGENWIKNKYSIVLRQLKNMRANLGVGKIGANQSNDSIKYDRVLYLYGTITQNVLRNKL